MSDLNDFQTFAELLEHCFVLKKDGRASEADTLMLAYIAEARRREAAEKMWSSWHLHQAIGLRTEFACDAAAAEMEYLKYSRSQHRYFANSLAETNARLSILHFEHGNPSLGHEHAVDAIRFSALVGHLTPTVVKAATYDRDYQAST
jgi:hypothetical protein